ncbi:hypothetical protein [Chlorobium sp. N1]|uniref:hypothetical protein n=1 Tax=Chlorobium sp. N1 TaxID=2491138 RepID=UPI00103AC118|nr:hypothetical protein [Chlorobium sp. N1]TCD47965.1 hypothetical protein E0L29_03405 [Chlorobium sp. N1]
MGLHQYSEAINAARPEALRESLRLLLAAHALPVFGAAKAVEHEVAALNALQVIGYLPERSDEFELVEKLRITKTKARNLLYQVALRQQGQSVTEIDDSLRAVLGGRHVLKDGSFFLVEVPDPLTMDRLRRRVRAAGYLSDGSFSGAIARIPEGALVTLIDELIDKHHKQEILKRLHKAGLADVSVSGFVKAFLITVGKKYAGEVGVRIGDHLVDLFEHGYASIAQYAGEVVNQLKSSQVSAVE